MHATKGVPAKIESYRDLVVWQRAIQMTLALYRLTAAFPREELYGLASQLRRAGVSVASNIAEGHGRASRGEYRQFLGIAAAPISNSKPSSSSPEASPWAMQR